MRDHISQLQTQISDLTKELESSEKKTDKHDEYADLLNSLYHKGIIDNKENFIE